MPSLENERVTCLVPSATPLRRRVFAARAALSALCAFLYAACGAATCPKGSTEVDGKCQEAKLIEGGERDAGDERAAGDAGTDGVVADADVPEPDSCELETTCTPGSEDVACLTACGTEGSGICTELCNPAPPEQCTPPTEVCNWVDDDCDGVTDPGMLKQLPGVKVFTAEVAGEALPEVSLLRRAVGGAWFLYSKSFSVLYGAGKNIHAHELGQDGKALGSLRVLPASARTLQFRAASDGKILAVLMLQRDVKENDSLLVKLVLYKASDLSFLAEYLVDSLLDDDGQRDERDDNDDCHFGAVAGVGVRTDDGGKVQVMLAYATAPGVPQIFAGGTLCVPSASYGVRLKAMTYTGAWEVPSASLTTPGEWQPFSNYVRVASVPCRNEWLVVYAKKGAPAGTVWEVSRVSTSGEILETGADALTPVGALLDLESSADEDCSVDPELYLTYAASPLRTGGTEGVGGLPYLRRWRISRTTGALDRVGGDIKIADIPTTARANIVSVGGRLLVGLSSGTQGVGLAAFNGSMSLFEISKDNHSSLRLASTLLGSEGAFENDLVSTGRALVVAGSVWDPATLNPLRDPGDTHPAVGALYRFGCE